MVTRGISISPRWAKNFTLMNALEDSDAVSAASQAEGLFGDVESLAYEPSELEGGPEGFAAGAELLEESSKRRRFKTAADGAKNKDWHLDQFPQDGNSQALCIHLARARSYRPCRSCHGKLRLFLALGDHNSLSLSGTQ